MSLRLRLIVAFFFLSVVPLAAVTLFTYASNARAMREAAGRESELLAGELSQRMQVVTAQLSERVERLMDVAEARAEASAATAALATTGTVEPVVAAVGPTQETQVAQALGEMAMLLENIELRGLRRRGGPPGGRGDREGRADQMDRVVVVAAKVVAAGVLTGRLLRRQQRRLRHRPRWPPFKQRRCPPRRVLVAPVPVVDGPPAGAAPPSFVPPPFPDRRPPPPASGPGAPTDPNAPPRDRILIDVGPMRRDIVRQIVPEGQWEKLTDVERRQIMDEVNQRMMGIAQGIQLGAAEAQKRVAEAQRAADAKAQAAAAAAAKAKPKAAPTSATAPVATARPSPARRKTALSGSRLDVTFERDGKVVRAANAEVNLPNLLATVLTTTRRDRGEIPVCGRQGRTPLHADRGRQEGKSRPSAAT